MKYSTQIEYASTIEETWEDEETDALFTQLLHVDPPATLVHDILAAVASLPLSEKTEVRPWGTQEEPKMLSLLLWSL